MGFLGELGGWSGPLSMYAHNDPVTKVS